MEQLRNNPQIAHIFISGALSLVLLVTSYYLARRYRFYTDTAASQLRSAAQGYSMISGNATSAGLPLLTAPLSKTPCVWYRYSIKRKKLFSHNNETIEIGCSEAVFVIQDNEHLCMIVGSNTHATTGRRYTWSEQSKTPIDSGKHKNKSWLTKLDKKFKTTSLFSTPTYYYEEERIVPDRVLHVAGYFLTPSDDDSQKSKFGDNWPTIKAYL